jgi:hypothetical protein
MTAILSLFVPLAALAVLLAPRRAASFPILPSSPAATFVLRRPPGSPPSRRRRSWWWSKRTSRQVYVQGQFHPLLLQLLL